MGLHQRIIRHILNPLALWRSGDSAQSRYLREYERTQYLTAGELRALQLKRLRAMLDHAYRRCPFYKERFDRLGLVPSDIRELEDLRALPALEKRDIQEQRDRMVAQDWPPDDLVPYATGGSTGAPLSFFLDRDRVRSRLAATVRHNRWAGWDIGDRFALLWGAPSDTPPRGWRPWLRKTLLEPHLFLNTGHLTEEGMVAFHAELERFRPKVVLAYARAGALFARFLMARGLPAYRPHAIVTSAEVLEHDDRRVIEEVFGCPVFNRYGCREVSIIASECEEHQGLHVMAEGLYVEIDRGSAPPRPGEVGNILVTDLLNRAMPLIRYRIGDVGAWETDDCPCGRGLPRLKDVAGRATDFLVGHDGRLVAGPFLAHSIVAKRPSLGQVQICQDEVGKLHFRIKPSREFRAPEDLDYLQVVSRQYLGETTAVGWELVDDLPSEPSGKYLFCRSSVAPQFLATPAPAGAFTEPGGRG